MNTIGRLAVIGLATTLAQSACSSQQATSGDASGTSDGSGAGSDGSDGGGTKTPLQRCIDDNAGEIKLVCDEPGSFEYVVGGSEFRCLGTRSFADVKLRFRFDLFEVVGGVPQILAVRFAESDDPRATEDLVELEAPQPTPLPALGATLRWKIFVRPMAMAGGLSFVEARSENAQLKFGAAYDPLALQDADGTPVRGTFDFEGGAFKVLDSAGDPIAVDDPTAAGRGCFNLTGVLEAIN